MPKKVNSKGKPSASLRARNQKSKPRTKKLKTLFGLIFILLGLLFLYKVPVPQKTQVAEEPIKMASFKSSDKESTPTRIIIPKNDIDLPITFSKIKKGYWKTSETTASHGEGSANPGEGGNVVVFAHAREGLFYNLKDVKKDDVIYVLTRDRWFKYKIKEIKNVYPNQIETIAPTDYEVLTLFTCSGFFDEKRLIVKALPVQ